MKTFRAGCAYLLFALAADQSALATGCKSRAELDRDISAYNVKVQVRSRESGGADTPEVCHLTKLQEALFRKLVAIVDASPTHCGLPDFKVQKLHSVSYDASRASCGANWK